ncbi:hypothetical protein [Herminiimonas sp.]|uniref:hypothetical protein n=1 Tax=Herminiimonas sp. TaxID=1926289 RepID=UPI00272D69B9|nr:hypothetical protein [Herminiimonas sp.]
MEQKIRSLHCRMQAGLNFQNLDGEDVVFLKDVPFEWEDIIARWILALPSDQTSMGMPDCILRQHPTKGIALTDEGWTNYISWMTKVLDDVLAKQESETFTRP